MLHGTPSQLPRPTGHHRSGDTKAGSRHRQPQHSRVTPRSRTRLLRDRLPARSLLALPSGGALALPRAGVLPVSPQRAAQALTRALAALIVLGVLGLVAFFIVADVRRGDPPSATAAADDTLRSRAADPAPLTLQEVFPDSGELEPPGGGPTYRVTMTHVDSECGIATIGTLGGLLAGHGCSQVVRASLTAPYGDYQVTTGLFNLADAAGATEVDSQLRRLVETGDGSFAAMAAGEPGSDPAIPAAAQVGWHSRGHYLLFCVITRPGGAVVPNDDPNAARITADLVDGYLSAGVLSRRGQTP